MRIIDSHVHLSATREALIEDLRLRASFGVSAAFGMGMDGAAMALEDAWEFARLLGRYPQTAGERFFVERFTRTTALQQRARRQAKIYHAHWLPLVASRNLLLSAGSRIAPQYLNRRLTQHFEWRAHE